MYIKTVTFIAIFTEYTIFVKYNKDGIYKSVEMCSFYSPLQY